MFTASLILCPAVLSGCSARTKSGENTAADSQEPISATAIKLNTAVTVTIYDSKDKDLLTECMNLCDKYEKVFSRTSADSELYKLNHRKLTPVEGTEDTYQVSDDLAELVSEGLDYSQLSEGAFDIAIEPLTSLWDFTAEDPQVPKDNLIQAALPKCDYHNISVNKTKKVRSSILAEMFSVLAKKRTILLLKSGSRNHLQTAVRQSQLWTLKISLWFLPEFMRDALNRMAHYIITCSILKPAIPMTTD